MSKRYVEQVAEAAAKESSDFEVISSSSESARVRWEKGELSENTQRATQGTGLNLGVNGKLGFAFRTDNGKPDALVESAKRLSVHGGELDYKFAPKADALGKELYDEALAAKESDYLFALCDEAKAKLAEAAPEALISATAGLAKGRSTIATSEGQIASERYAQTSLSISAELNIEGDFLSAYGSTSQNRVIVSSDIDAAVKRAADDFNNARKIAEISEGSYKVLLTPDALSDALTPIMVSANGLYIEKKVSRWVDSMGEKVFGDNITIWDDPTHSDGPACTIFDGEGVPAQRRAIIENGVIKSFAHSLSSAARTGVDATGNAMRSASSSASPGFHNVVMEGGETPLADLMQQSNGGLMIRYLIGVFTSNFLAGQVSGNVMTGFRIEGGESAGRVKNCAINFNLFDVFNGKVLGISKEREWTGSMYLPYVLVDAVALSAS